MTEIVSQPGGPENPSDDEFASRLHALHEALLEASKSTDGQEATAHRQLAEIKSVLELLNRVRRLPADGSGTQPKANAAEMYSGGTKPYGSHPEKTLPLTRIDNYEIIEEVARGGMGIVFRARHESLDRIVALKIMRAGPFAQPEERQRFRVEAEAAAQLDHPGIVPIHDVGEFRGLPYFTMTYVDGESLSQHIGREPLDPKVAAELTRQIADAVEYAHRKGVIHRDIKPLNVLIDQDGQARITDFGLARRTDSDSDLTGTGQVLGTPSFMSPEQASGKTDGDGRLSDVYSIGATLYCMLTGRPPFQAACAVDTLRLVVDKEPLTPRQLNPLIDVDLATICLKCLHKDPHRRYGSAAQLSADLQRFQNGEPILALPIGAPARTWRWCKRNPLVATLLATVFLGFQLILLVLVVSNFRISEQRDAARYERERAVDRLYDVLLREVRNLRQARSSAYRSQAWEILRQAEQLDASHTDRFELRAEAVACMGDFVGLEPQTLATFAAPIKAFALLRTGSLAAVGFQDGAVAIHDLDAGTQSARFGKHDSPVTALAFGPRGTWLAVAHQDGFVERWQSSENSQWRLAGSLQVSPNVVSISVPEDGKRMFVSSWDADAVESWQVPQMTRLAALHGQGAMLGRTALSPDARLLASRTYRDGDHGVVLWETEGRRQRQATLTSLGEINDLTFSPDSQLLACACEEGIGIYDADTLQHRFSVRGQVTSSVDLCPGRPFVAFVSFQSNLVELWDILTNRSVATLSMPRAHDGLVKAVFSGNGKRLIVASSHGLYGIRLTGTKERLAFADRSRGIPALDFSPDGQFILSASKAGVVNLWSADGTLIRTIAEFDAAVQTVAFHPNGEWFATGDWNGGIRVWNASNGTQVARIANAGLGSWIWRVGFSRDGRLLAACGAGVAVWRLSRTDSTAGEKTTLDRVASLADVGDVTELAFGRNGESLAFADTQRRLHLWNVAAGSSQRFGAVHLKGNVHSLAVHPKGNDVLFVNQDGNVEIFSMQHRQRARQFGNGELAGATTLGVVALSDDGAQLASHAAVAKATIVWDVERATPTLLLPEERSAIWCMDWSPDAAKLALGLADGKVVVWDLAEVRSELAKLNLDY